MLSQVRIQNYALIDDIRLEFSHGLNVLTQASYFKPSCIDVVKKISGKTGEYPNWQSVLIAVMGK